MPSKDEVSRRRATVLSAHLNPHQRSTTHLTCYPRQQMGHSDACGIIAFISKDEPAFNYLMEGLTILQNRGYDSAGICTLTKTDKETYQLQMSKYASLNTTSDALIRLQTSQQEHRNNNIGMAHTRWATHGGKTDRNAHPHPDHSNRLAVVHNGVIENAGEIKQELIKDHGITFRSETDTEVVAQLLSVNLQKVEKQDSALSHQDALLRALEITISSLEGTWGLVIISRELPDRLIAVCNGSPLVVGLSDSRNFIASESSAFSRYTQQMITLVDHEIAIVKADDVQLVNKDAAVLKDRTSKVQEDEHVTLSPDPYPHWTIKEIMEQPQAVSRALNFGGRLASDKTVMLGGLDHNQGLLEPIKHLVIAACGTSLYAARFGAKMMRHLRCFETVQVVDAAELEADDFAVHDGGLLVISQSGETADVFRCVQLAEELNIPRFSIVNKVGSLIARSTMCGVYVNAGREHAVASTKAFSCQVTVLCLVALWFAQVRDAHGMTQQRQTLVSALHRLPTHIGMISNKIRDQCKVIAKKLVPHNSMFVLGKGLGESIAQEGSLKIKEITYLHAEGYSSGALKHGPFALISDGTPIVVLCLDDKHLSLNLTCLHEVQARNAYVIAITDIPNKLKTEMNPNVPGEILTIPHNGVLTAMLAVVPLQLIAYELACAKGINCDKPRNLAKTVTVK
ncbi:glutamine-fructose-6-phosphate transaminase [Acrasis kona]|uniref:Glutamine--fructose-6-phosphate aminotransferase [isomerizing] n=1 Tax=Acrasis kona TaxID=1008807 RepID=A0AAW2YWW3_9EUKA